jgi:hypothetical protein
VEYLVDLRADPALRIGNPRHSRVPLCATPMNCPPLLIAPSPKAVLDARSPRPKLAEMNPVQKQFSSFNRPSASL